MAMARGADGVVGGSGEAVVVEGPSSTRFSECLGDQGLFVSCHTHRGVMSEMMSHLFWECLTSVTVLLAISASPIRLTRTFMFFFLIGSPPATVFTTLLARATLQGTVGL